ncbi:hypothetical protein F5Y03DRAFT_354611 [Xylaria venustula]|nr:hypothetical protein F5Y03DRAFT_354611 [Xylaria venustula]
MMLTYRAAATASWKSVPVINCREISSVHSFVDRLSPQFHYSSHLSPLTMFHRALVFLALVALSVGTPIGQKSPRSASVCVRQTGIYDVCDTLHSFLRCRGYKPTMAFDCTHAPDHYCIIQNDKGSCNGLLPPPLNGTITH